jgi:hypothetical protein
MLTGFLVGFSIAFLTFLWVFQAEPLFGPITYQPDSLGLGTQAEIAANAAGAFTFGQLLPLGSWVFGIGYSLFLVSCQGVQLNK